MLNRNEIQALSPVGSPNGARFYSPGRSAAQARDLRRHLALKAPTGRDKLSSANWAASHSDLFPFETMQRGRRESAPLARLIAASTVEFFSKTFRIS
jgi:hypothetical protein